MKIATGVTAVARRDEAALDRERADAGEDVAAVLLVAHLGAVGPHLQEEVVDVDAGALASG